MYTAINYDKLDALMASSPEAHELIQNLLDTHQFTISKISHEIRNPLTLVYSTLQLIECKHPEVKSFAHWPYLMEDVEFMNQLLSELSTYHNPQHLNYSVFDFAAVLKHICLSFAAGLENTNVEFSSSISLSVDNINGDKVKLQEVFLNLLKNAKDSIEDYGSIFLTACNDEQNVIVTIKDTGCGISPELLESVFTPFVTHKKGGTGLGLPLVEKVVTAHGGSISVDSAVNLGTTFTVTLPV